LSFDDLRHFDLGHCAGNRRLCGRVGLVDELVARPRRLGRVLVGGCRLRNGRRHRAARHARRSARLGHGYGRTADPRLMRGADVGRCEDFYPRLRQASRRHRWDGRLDGAAHRCGNIRQQATRHRPRRGDYGLSLLCSGGAILARSRRKASGTMGDDLLARLAINRASSCLDPIRHFEVDALPRSSIL
jgi:hypothetical protein